VKKRILFVDDEILVLQGLQRMLRPMREEWEMEFIDGGAKALERMAATSFDVVVSDMRMPGMNGAELLSRVMQHYPKTVRLVLSGHADKELILKCIGSTHQFLAKPCDPEAIKAIVRRASATGDALQSDTLKRLVAQMSHLPSIPALYTRMIEALQDPEATMDAVGGIVSEDMAMTAQLLKLVNSAFFGLRRQVSSPAEAANYLGLDTIRSVVLLINVFSQYQSVKIEGFSLSTLGAHSLDTGVAAKGIAQLEGADRKLADEAFVAGMLHDTGKIVLAANFAWQYGDVLKLMRSDGFDQYRAEQRVFGADHAEVGGYLLGLWGLPVPVVEAIAFHHRPADVVEKTFSPLTAVHVANALVHFMGEADPVFPNRRLDITYLTGLGLIDRAADWLENVRKGAPILQEA
jgi:HD-like signal output (HDOD) protein